MNISREDEQTIRKEFRQLQKIPVRSSIRQQDADDDPLFESIDANEIRVNQRIFFSKDFNGLLLGCAQETRIHRLSNTVEKHDERFLGDGSPISCDENSDVGSSNTLPTVVGNVEQGDKQLVHSFEQRTISPVRHHQNPNDKHGAFAA